MSSGLMQHLARVGVGVGVGVRVGVRVVRPRVRRVRVRRVRRVWVWVRVGLEVRVDAAPERSVERSNPRLQSTGRSGSAP